MPPLREIGEAEIFELCLPLAAGARFFYIFFLDHRKSRGHGHGHGADFGHFEAFSIKINVF